MGIAADVGTLQILPQCITDHGLFRELVYTSRAFNTDEAQKIGLVRYCFSSSRRLSHRTHRSAAVSSMIVKQCSMLPLL